MRVYDTCLLLLVPTPTTQSFQLFSSFARSLRCSSVNTDLHDVRVTTTKPRRRVVKDLKTGFYRPEYIATESSTKGENNLSGGVWCSIKESLYKSYDIASALPNKINKFTLRQQSFSTANTAKSYREVEQRIYESESPGTRLVEEIEHQHRLKDDISPRTDENSVLFQNFQKHFFNGSSIFHRNIPSSGDLTTNMAVFKPVIKSSLRNSGYVQESLRDLQSDNPVLKAISQYLIQDWDHKEDRIVFNVDRYRMFRQVKEIVYLMKDAVQKSALFLFEFPSQTSSLARKIRADLESLPSSLRKASESITSIPILIAKKSNDLSISMNRSVATAQKIVHDAESFPSKVMQTTEATKNTTLIFIDAVNDKLISGKVRLGLEKANPRPPKSPPPSNEFRLETTGWKVASGIASATWWTLETVAILAWRGQHSAIVMVEEAFKKQNNLDLTSGMLSTNSKRPTMSLKSVEADHPLTESPASTNTTRITMDARFETKKAFSLREESIAKRSDDVERQVDEALKLAEEAMKMVEWKEDKE